MISEPEPTAEVISINDNDDDNDDDDESEVKDEQVSLKPRQVLRTSTFYQVHLLLKLITHIELTQEKCCEFTHGTQR